jgi:hypothetical protein
MNGEVDSWSKCYEGVQSTWQSKGTTLKNMRLRETLLLITLSGSAQSFNCADQPFKIVGTNSIHSHYTESILTICFLRRRASLCDWRQRYKKKLRLAVRCTLYHNLSSSVIAFLRFGNRGKKYGVFSPRGPSNNLRISFKYCPMQQCLIEFQWFCFMIRKCGHASKLTKNL